jgi:hypothetical protein
LEENFDVAQADIDEGLQAGSGARDILKVEGKLSSSVAARFGFDGLGENFADGVEYAGIVDRVRFSRGEATPTRSASDRGSIDDNDFIDRTDVLQFVNVFGKWYPFGEVVL